MNKDENNLPFVSVIVISKDRHDSLLKTVNSLKEVYYSKDKYEIIVVEEGDKPLVIDGTKYVFLPRRHLGLGYARNNGVNNSKGKILVFTDDDVIVDKNWLKELVKTFFDPAIYGVAGLVRSQRYNIIGDIEEILGLPGGGIKRLAECGGRVAEINLLSGCNSAYRREVFNEFKYREDSFGKFGGDDWFLGKTVSEKYKCVYNPKAVVFHKPRANVLRLIHTYYRRQITDYLGKRDIYGDSKTKAIFGKKHQCVIFKFLLALGILLIFKVNGLAFLISFYYLLSIVSIRSLFKFANSKISFFIYPFIKFVTEIGILKGEMLILFCSEEKFNKILEKY